MYVTLSGPCLILLIKPSCESVCPSVGVRALQFAAKKHYIEKSKKDRNFVLSGKSAYCAIINSERLN